MRDDFDPRLESEFDDAMEEAVPTPARRRRLRLVPITSVMLSLLLVIKVNEIYIDSQQLRELYTARDAHAQDPVKKEEAKTDHAAAEKPADAAKPDAAPEEKKDAAPADAAKKEEAPAADAKPEAAGHGEAKKEEGGHGGGEAKPPEEPKTFGTGKSTVKEIDALKAREAGSKFSQNEIDLLENLAKRRGELDTREKELELKTKILDATQKRINDRIEEMKTLEAQLSKTVAQYDEKQNAQIASLVKIYENMKPIQAAAIFNELDLPILLEVIDRMSERKVAPVLALMDPKKARDVTQELAAMRKAAPKKPGTATPPAKK